MADVRICSNCGSEYNALHEPKGHHCKLHELQRAALVAFDGGDMDEYNRLNSIIAAKVLGSHTSPAKARSSAANGAKGGRPRKASR